MGRIANRQLARADISAKEMVSEYHEHWEWYDEYPDYHPEDDWDRYVFPDSSDEKSVIADDYPDWGDDFSLPFDYHDEIYLETTYHP